MLPEGFRATSRRAQDATALRSGQATELVSLLPQTGQGRLIFTRSLSKESEPRPDCSRRQSLKTPRVGLPITNTFSTQVKPRRTDTISRPFPCLGIASQSHSHKWLLTNCMHASRQMAIGSHTSPTKRAAVKSSFSRFQGLASRCRSRPLVAWFHNGVVMAASFFTWD